MDLRHLLIQEGRFVDFMTQKKVRASPIYLGILLLEDSKEERILHIERIHKLACSYAPIFSYPQINSYVINPSPDISHESGKRHWPFMRIDPNGDAIFNLNRPKKSVQKVLGQFKEKLNVRDTYVELIPVLYCHTI